MHTVVVASVDSAELDAELARKAAASLIQPHKTPEKIAGDLLERLQKVKLLRESRGLNHWEEFAPAYLQKLLARHEAARRAAIAEFLRAELSIAVAQAEAQLGNRADAEDVVSETFLELLEGRTSIPHFYHALKANVLNRLEGLGNRSKRICSLDKVVSSATLGLEQAACGEEGSDTLSFEPISHHREDQDPLDILIAREREEARRQRVAKAIEIARGCRKYRWVRAKNWARPLEIRAAA